jgi:prolyl oligopeptidase
VDRYHGVEVTDDYQWLEAGADPEVRAWSEAQNAAARSHLDGLPALEILRDRVRTLLGSSVRYGPVAWRGGLLFALKHQPPLQQVLLVAISDLDDLATERVIVDPNAMDPAGATAIDWCVPSLDGRLVAVSLSSGGSENGTLHIFDVVSGAETGDAIPRVQYGTGGGSVAWLADSTSLLYTRYPQEGEVATADLNFYQEVWRHELGTPVERDRHEVGDSFPRIAEVDLATSDDGRRAFARVAHGDGGDVETWLRGLDGRWRRLSTVEDRVIDGHFAAGSLWLHSLRGAPNGKLLRLDPDGELADATTVVGESSGSITRWTASDDSVYVVLHEGGPSELHAFRHDGTHVSVAPVPSMSSIRSLVHLDGDEVLFSHASYTRPESFVRWSAGADALVPTAMQVTSPADFSSIEIVRDEAVSRDGTTVPMTILRSPGIVLDGTNPTLLYGYGGYGLSLEPTFDPVLLAWLEQGAVYAQAHLRGGGEFGDAWHRAGHLTRKQNVFDDFIACAERLVEAGYTSPERLAIQGASNGGLLMGAALTQRPDLFRAVACNVGVLDSLRVERDDNGAFNVTEFGTVTDPDHFRALLAYSPYANVRDGVAYPAVLLSTGANDPRVNPYHSRKMAARLQAASSSGRPVLLRTSDKAGHGMGSALDETVALRADQYAFLLGQLGVAVHRVS